MKKQIFLTGMPGSGKSTIGRLLSNETKLPFFDLDEIIEKEAGISISSIFERSGESAFRQLESESLKNFITSHSQFILATGGGTPCFHNNLDLINSKGISIYLKISVKELFARLKRKIAHRPLLKGKTEQELMEELKIKLMEREKYYIQSTYVVEGDTLNIQHILPLLEENSD